MLSPAGGLNFEGTAIPLVFVWTLGHTLNGTEVRSARNKKGLPREPKAGKVKVGGNLFDIQRLWHRARQRLIAVDHAAEYPVIEIAGIVALAVALALAAILRPVHVRISAGEIELRGADLLVAP